ncbi:MAG TPA: MMPL family transporter [Solirubrobacteraceae bacterium]|nr:MMPL family transporter [Solirubrobacteraceae bacterium]
MIARLVILAVKRPRRVLTVAGALFVVAAVLGLPVAGMLGSTAKDFQDPASQFERASAAITAATGQNAFYNVAVLLRAPRDIESDPGAWRAAATVAGLLAAQHGFQRALDYGGAGIDSRSPALLSRDGDETVVLAAFASEADATTAVSRVRADIAGPRASARLAGIAVRYGGVALINQELNERTASDLARAELLAFPLLLALSFWFFRGLVAALLPLLVGGFAIVAAFLALRLVDQFTPISVFALNLVSGMGLGLGIDYSLFVLYRYREELAGGADARAAIDRTLHTVGRTVIFSCLTVAAAMTSLLVFPLRFLYSMGIGGAIVTLCDGAVALLVLPALLIALGPRVNSLAPAWLQRRAARAAAAAERTGGWWRLAHAVVRRPGRVALISAIMLIAVAIPAAGLEFTSPAANLLPAGAESRVVETALAESFPSNPGEATEIVLTGARSSAQRLAAASALAAGRLASVAPPVALNRRTWEVALMPRGSAFTSSQQRLLARLRALAHPYRALVGGATAFFVDEKSAIASHIPLALLILLPLTALFLFAMTGSVAIPIKALVMNMLSVGVGTGLLVFIFQDGHLSGVLGFTPIGGLEEASLVLMLVVTFALATDYEVFVLARIKEAHDQGLPTREAIALGIERTGRIITAAALLFCVAIGALATSSLFFTKQLGLGAALAVAIDASIIRALLVPSLMALMGRWNWWAPAPLRRLHDRIGVRDCSHRRSTLVLAEGAGPSTSSRQPESDRSNT